MPKAFHWASGAFSRGVARNERLADFVPNVTEVELDCSHWIMDEMPHETNHAILTWLGQHETAPARHRTAHR